MIYADFEALVRKIPGCEREPKSKQKSYTDKTELYQALCFSYMVVRSDGPATRPMVYRGKNPVKEFLNQLSQVEIKIRDILANPNPTIMTDVDWLQFNTENNCHIHVCEKNLIKDEYLDSLQVWNSKEEFYLEQWHKECYYNAKKEEEWSFIRLKRLTEEIYKSKADLQGKCGFCKTPLLRKNFRDVLKDHCDITGKYHWPS